MRRRWRRDLLDVSTQLTRYRRVQAGGGGELAELQRAWAEIVGSPASDHSIVVRRSRAGVVAIACSSSAWAQELDFRRDRWTADLARRVEPLVVRGVRFVVGDHVMPPPARRRREPVVPTAHELAQADASTPQLADQRLRDLLVRAQAGQLALQRERKRLQKADNARRGSRPD